MQLCPENILSVAFVTCAVQQLHPLYILLDIVGGHLYSIICMACYGIRAAFVWLSNPEPIEDHVLYHATVGCK